MRLAEEIRSIPAYTRLSTECRYVLDLALEEMATNVIKYAFDGKNEQAFDISIVFGGKIITLVLEDNGREFNPLTARRPEDLPVEERAVGGVGIYLVAKMAKSISYVRRDDRNILTIEISNP